MPGRPHRRAGGARANRKKERRVELRHGQFLNLPAQCDVLQFQLLWSEPPAAGYVIDMQAHVLDSHHRRVDFASLGKPLARAHCITHTARASGDDSVSDVAPSSSPTAACVGVRGLSYFVGDVVKIHTSRIDTAVGAVLITLSMFNPGKFFLDTDSLLLRCLDGHGALLADVICERPSSVRDCVAAALVRVHGPKADAYSLASGEGGGDSWMVAGWHAPISNATLKRTLLPELKCAVEAIHDAQREVASLAATTGVNDGGSSAHRPSRNTLLDASNRYGAYSGSDIDLDSDSGDTTSRPFTPRRPSLSVDTDSGDDPIDAQYTFPRPPRGSRPPRVVREDRKHYSVGRPATHRNRGAAAGGGSGGSSRLPNGAGETGNGDGTVGNLAESDSADDDADDCVTAAIGGTLPQFHAPVTMRYEGGTYNVGTEKARLATHFRAKRLAYTRGSSKGPHPPSSAPLDDPALLLEGDSSDSVDDREGGIAQEAEMNVDTSAGADVSDTVVPLLPPADDDHNGDDNGGGSGSGSGSAALGKPPRERRAMTGTGPPPLPALLSSPASVACTAGAQSLRDPFTAASGPPSTARSLQRLLVGLSENGSPRAFSASRSNRSRSRQRTGSPRLHTALRCRHGTRGTKGGDTPLQADVRAQLGSQQVAPASVALLPVGSETDSAHYSAHDSPKNAPASPRDGHRHHRRGRRHCAGASARGDLQGWMQTFLSSGSQRGSPTNTTFNGTSRLPAVPLRSASRVGTGKSVSGMRTGSCDPVLERRYAMLASLMHKL